jgi:hypothetical protein
MSAFFDPNYIIFKEIFKNVIKRFRKDKMLDNIFKFNITNYIEGL